MSDSHAEQLANHIPFAETYANEAARLAATGFTRGLAAVVVPFDSSDVGKIALQLGAVNSIWMLTAITPTWEQVDGISWNRVSNEQQLASVAAVNLNVGTATLLYTVPSGKSCIITKVVIRNASTSLTTASISFGFNSAPFDDVIADAAYVELTGNTLYSIVQAMIGAAKGAAAGTFKVKANTLQGAAATVTIDVFGYLF